MKREEVKSILGEEVTKETLDAILELNGKDVEREKAKTAAAEKERDEAKESLTVMQTELDGLKASNASAEDYKAKFEALTADVQKKEQEAAKAAAEKERAEKIAARFASVSEGKNWTHDAVKKSYMDAFAAALNDENNAGKSDADIFHELVKDDAGAFRTVQGVKMPAARQGGEGKPLPKDEILSIKNPNERYAAMAEALAYDPNYFNTKGNEK